MHDRWSATGHSKLRVAGGHDDPPFAGPGPAATIFHYPRSRRECIPASTWPGTLASFRQSLRDQ